MAFDDLWSHRTSLSTADKVGRCDSSSLGRFIDGSIVPKLAPTISDITMKNLTRIPDPFLGSLSEPRILDASTRQCSEFRRLEAGR